MGALAQVYSMIKLEDHANKLRTLNWTDDGQLLSVCTATGDVCTYLTKLPMIGAHSPRVCMVVSGMAVQPTCVWLSLG